MVRGFRSRAFGGEDTIADGPTTPIAAFLRTVFEEFNDYITRARTFAKSVQRLWTDSIEVEVPPADERTDHVLSSVLSSDGGPAQKEQQPIPRTTRTMNCAAQSDHPDLNVRAGTPFRHSTIVHHFNSLYWRFLIPLAKRTTGHCTAEVVGWLPRWLFSGGLCGPWGHDEDQSSISSPSPIRIQSHHWSSPDGRCLPRWDILVRELRKLALEKDDGDAILRVAEVGVFKGHTSERLLVDAPQNLELFLVDPLELLAAAAEDGKHYMVRWREQELNATSTLGRTMTSASQRQPRGNVGGSAWGADAPDTQALIARLSKLPNAFWPRTSSISSGTERLVDGMNEQHEEPKRPRFHVIRQFSAEATVQFDDASLDLVFIDGDHSYAEVLKDLRVWAPKIRAGGLLIGHDVDLPEVFLAVVEFLAERRKQGRRRDVLHVDGDVTYWIHM